MLYRNNVLDIYIDYIILKLINALCASYDEALANRCGPGRFHVGQILKATENLLEKKNVLLLDNNNICKNN